MLYRLCPICGNDKHTKIETIKMVLPSYVSIPNHYNVVACNKCGFTFADTSATQEDYNEYYKNCNIYSGNADIKIEVTEKAQCMRYQLISKYIGKDAKILDMGCGSGSLLVYLKKKGYRNLFGIDPSMDSVTRLRNSGIDGQVGNIFFEVPENLKHTFDVVLCTAVIEHVYQVDSLVERLMQYLVNRADKGYIFIDAPAVEGFERYITKSANYFNHEHINYFSLCTLDNLMKKYHFDRINSDEESYCIYNGEQSEMGLQAIYRYNRDLLMEYDYDEIGLKSITHYFKQVRETENESLRIIRKFIKQNNRIVIWGTGSYTMQLLAKVPELINAVVFFCDSNEMKKGMEICEKKVYPPEYLLSDTNSYPIIICSMLNSKDIVKQIKDMGLGNGYIIA